MLTGISATTIFIYVLFGSFVLRSGLGEFFTKIAGALAGRGRGGPAKIAVVSSGLYGMISGSSVANLSTTGTFSIPLMKRVGYRAQFAGAVESASGTGGMLMPPIMGVGAFVMAELTATPYWDIAKMAAVPAILYYISLLAMVHFEAGKRNLRPVPLEKVPTVREALREAYLLGPVIVIVWLLVRGYTPALAAFWAIVVTVGLSWIQRRTRMGPRAILEALVLAQ